MIIPTIDRRLRAVCDEVRGHVMADIGCDHGLCTAVCLCEDRVEKALACDISAPSLHKARTLISRLGLEDRTEFRVGDGFAVINTGEADIAVIAGMGGREIIRILTEGEDKGVERFVFVAHRDAPALREYMSQSGLKADKDYIVECGRRFYDVICASKGDYALDTRRKYFGASPLESVDFRRYVEACRVKYGTLSQMAVGVRREYYAWLKATADALVKELE